MFLFVVRLERVRKDTVFHNLFTVKLGEYICVEESLSGVAERETTESNSSTAVDSTLSSSDIRRLVPKLSSCL